MPNPTVPAAAPGLPSVSPSSRRAILTAFPAAAIGVGALRPFAALAAADPIFPVIEQHRAAEAVYSDVCGLIDEVAAERQGRTIIEAEHDAVDAAQAASDIALAAMLAVVPTTIAGVRALLEYAREIDWNGWELDGAVAAVLRSPTLAGGARV